METQALSADLKEVLSSVYRVLDRANDDLRAVVTELEPGRPESAGIDGGDVLLTVRDYADNALSLAHAVAAKVEYVQHALYRAGDDQADECQPAGPLKAEWSSPVSKSKPSPLIRR